MVETRGSRKRRESESSIESLTTTPIKPTTAPTTPTTTTTTTTPTTNTTTTPTTTTTSSAKRRRTRSNSTLSDKQSPGSPRVVGKKKNRKQIPLDVIQEVVEVVDDVDGSSVRSAKKKKKNREKKQQKDEKKDEIMEEQTKEQDEIMEDEEVVIVETPPKPTKSKRSKPTSSTKKQVEVEVVKEIPEGVDIDNLGSEKTQQAIYDDIMARNGRGKGNGSGGGETKKSVEKVTETSQPGVINLTMDSTDEEEELQGQENDVEMEQEKEVQLTVMTTPQKDTQQEQQSQSQTKGQIPSPPLAGLSIPPNNSPPTSTSMVNVNPVDKSSNVNLKVHRFRHAEYSPTAILRMCATPYHESYGTNPNSYIAISREGGSVELVSPTNHGYRCMAKVEGTRRREVDTMVWICGNDDDDDTSNRNAVSDGSPSPIGTSNAKDKVMFSTELQASNQTMHHQRRLFGASVTGTLFEIDFRSKSHIGVMDSGGGAVYCLETLYPFIPDKAVPVIAAGCEDGSVRLFRVIDRKDEDYNPSRPVLDLISTLPSAGSPITSLVWRRGTDIDGIGGSTIFAGVGDGTIRRYDCKPGSQSALSISSTPHATSTGMLLGTRYQWKSTSRITLESRGKEKHTKVWALKLLSDGTLISGDSMGIVNLWDINGGNLIQRFEHNHMEMDVYDVEVSRDESRIFASGVDPTIVFIQREKHGAHNNKWFLSFKECPHTHDVNSLTIVHTVEKKHETVCREYLCSGGLDTKVFSYHINSHGKKKKSIQCISEFRPKNPYKYAPDIPIGLARHARILTVMRSTSVDFYQLEENDPDLSYEPMNEYETLIGTLKLKGAKNFVSCDISDDGQYVAISESGEGLRLYSIKHIDDIDEGMKLRFRQMEIPSSATLSYAVVKFTTDSRLVCATANGPIAVLRIQDEDASVEHIFDNHIPISSSASSFPVSQLTVSPDNKFFAVSRNTMSQASIKVYSIFEKTYQDWWSLPSFDCLHSCVRFSDCGEVEPALVVACNDNSFYLFNAEDKCLSEWSADLGFPIPKRTLPRELALEVDYPASLTFNPATPNKFFMGNSDWFCSINLEEPIPSRALPHPRNHIRARGWDKPYKLEKQRFDYKQKKGKTIKAQPKQIINGNFKICLRYTGIIFMDFLDDNELVVVEQPWLDVVRSMANPVKRFRFGAI